ncbi:GNAT family N-acetyltransferase [Parasynechococcus sp.]|uniref:GNAT family N-acetyltransferase n=1 Tax=Parasynechococcus sp. TaxID=3101203 RepID=UPI003704AA7C
MSDLQIRPLQDSDIPTVVNWARLEDFAPGIGDITIYRNTDRQGIWLGWQGDTPVGCIAGVKYNQCFGFIGLYIVQRDFRGHGHGHQLWETALNHLSDVDCIGLEAAPKLIDHYGEWGFRSDAKTIRWQLHNRHPEANVQHRADQSGLEVIRGVNLTMEAVHEYDAKREATPRHHFLTQWLSHPAGDVMTLMDNAGQCHGFARIRPCLLPIAEGWRIGPILADSAELARVLLDRLLIDHPGVVLIDSPATNQSAAMVLSSLGFKQVSATTRMYRGTVKPLHNDAVFGLACLELG